MFYNWDKIILTYDQSGFKNEKIDICDRPSFRDNISNTHYINLKIKSNIT